MKRIFKKNQVIITALAIMIAVAGYLDYAGKHKEEPLAEETGSMFDPSDLSAEDLGEDTYLSGTLDNLIGNENKSEETKTQDQNKETEDSKTTTKQKTTSGSSADVSDSLETSGETANKDNQNTDNTGEAVLVNSKIGGDFFSSAKLSREQVRAKNKETLMEIIENVDVSESQKQEAINSMIALTDIAEKENAAELLLSAKGFEMAVVQIVDGSVDVVIAADSITDSQVAQITDIVTRKTGISAEHMVITPVSIEK